MEGQCEVVYYNHSGFTVANNDTIAVFDYWESKPGTISEEKKLTAERLKQYAHVYVFTSHAHPDHMDPIIYTWDKAVPIVYITSFDTPVGTRGRRMSPGDEMILHQGVNIKAFASTDTGVSYLLDLYGMKIFHAGDLNLWHWREESSLREIEAAEKAFEEAMAPITKEHVDIAMFPVDPRQGALFDAGANHFILSVKPKVFIPMHWQGRPEVAIEFARRAANKATGVFALTKPREKLIVHFADDVITVEVFNQKETTPASLLKDETKEVKERVVDFFTEQDPFLDSDMPVNISDDNTEGKKV